MYNSILVAHNTMSIRRSLQGESNSCHHIISDAVQTGNTDELVKLGYFEYREYTPYVLGWFSNSCYKNYLDVAKWLYKAYNLKCKPGSDILVLFENACLRGHLHMAQWLYEAYEIPLANGRNKSLMLQTCLYGHLDIIQWIHDVTHLSSDKLGEFGPGMLRYACNYEHIDVANWLASTYNIVPQCEEIFLDACCNGNWSTIAWLMNTFGVTKQSLQPYVACGLASVCKKTRAVSLVRRLLREFELDASYVNDNDSLVFRTIVRYDKLHNIQWLWRTYKPKLPTSRAIITSNERSVDCLQWLYVTIGYRQKQKRRQQAAVRWSRHNCWPWLRPIAIVLCVAAQQRDIATEVFCRLTA